MRNKIIIFLGVIGVIFLALVIVYFRRGEIKEKQTEKKLLFYCGAGLRPPVSEIVKIFSREHNVKIDCTYAGAATLRIQIQVTKRGDFLCRVMSPG